MIETIDLSAGRQLGLGLSQLAEMQEKKRKEEALKQKEMQAAQRRQMAQTAAMDAFKTNDPSKMAEVAIQYPEIQKQMETAFGYTNDASKRVAQQSYQRALADPKNASQYIQAGVENLEGMGIDPQNMRNDLAMLQQNPEQAMRQITLGVATTAPEMYKALQDELATKQKNKEFGLKEQTFGLKKDEFEQKKLMDSASLRMNASKINMERRKLAMRRTEDKTRTLEQQLKSETNQLKRDKLALEIKEKKQKIEESENSIRSNIESEISIVDRSIATVDQLINHSGLDAAVGASSLFPTIAGSEAADFEALLSTFDAQSFLREIQSMKGFGALSNEEGKKVAAAAAALNVNMSEKAFRKSLNTIRETLNASRSRLNKNLPASKGASSKIDSSKLTDAELLELY